VVTQYSRAVPALILACFAVLTISNLQAEASKSKKKRTPTPTATAVAARPAAAPAPTSAPAVSTRPPAAAAPAAPTSAPAVPPAGPAKADVEAGKALYAKFCQKCHGAQGEGVPRMYQLVGAKIVPLSSPQTQGKSDADIKKNMLEGIGKMEVVEDLTPQQADKILAFVRSLGEAKH
jgi:mono/diheme cytochrome c family protein